MIPKSQIFSDIYNTLHSPNAVHVKNTQLQTYFVRQLLLKCISVFKWELPENWARNYFLYTLYGFGYNAIIYTAEYGVIPQWCTLGGEFTVQYQPSEAVIANPRFVTPLRLKIGEDCEIMRLFPDYQGIMDIVFAYADLLALAYQSAGSNLLNSQLAYVFFASNKSMAESWKKMYDQIHSGDPVGVIGNKVYDELGNRSWEAFEQNLKQVFITPELLNCMQQIENMFDTEVGLPNANLTKRERLIKDEATANNVETLSKMDMVLTELQESCDRVNAKYGGYMEGRLSVDWRVKPDELDPDGTEGDTLAEDREGL